MIARLLESLKRRLTRGTAEPAVVAAEPVAAEPVAAEPVAAQPALVTPEEVAPEAQPNAVPPAPMVADEVASADDAPPDVEEVTAEPAREAVTAPADAGVVLRLDSARAEPVSFAVTRTGATVGRAPENGIRLDDLSVSRKHARIAYRQGAYWLSDVGSVGGTWVDGTKLNAPRRLAAGQVIDIGVCRLTVVSLGGTPSAPARKRT